MNDIKTISSLLRVADVGPDTQVDVGGLPKPTPN